MRLHLNENTAGCSPAVMEVLSRLERTHAAFYPDYEAANVAVANSLGVAPDRVLLTNGLDEGILAATGAALRDRRGPIPEALGVEPAFDMYETLVNALGGRMVTVPMDADFTLPGQALRRAVTEATRIVFVTNPHNPSGVVVPEAELLSLARDIAPVLLFVDEAYADFAGETLIEDSRLIAMPNLIVGRTFSKGYGLAGLRVGALLAHPGTLEPMRAIVPPYSVNAWAAAAIPAAIADRAYRDWYLEQAAASRVLLAEAFTRLGLRTWPSAANFLLVRVGDSAAIVRGLAARGVRVRDRSGDAGCANCIRITAGVVDDTRRAIAALEEVLCAAR
jgi:histidinol-phosphate aminotransferase